MDVLPAGAIERWCIVTDQLVNYPAQEHMDESFVRPRVAPPQLPATRVEQTYRIISYVLRGGVLLSAGIMLVGVLDVVRLALTSPHMVSLALVPHSLGAVLAGLGHGDPLAIIVLGLLVLLATPVVRVAVSIVAFAVERDPVYTAITTLVLLILCTSFALGPILPAEPTASLHVTPQLGVFLVIFAASVLAGGIGALAGLGGGVLIVPLLTLVFHLPIAEAIGASIVSVIATSSGAAAAYVRDHLTNLRVGMFLEIATTTGAIVGAFLVVIAPTAVLFIVFGLVLLVSALPLLVKIGEELPQHVVPDQWANRLRLSGTYPDRRLHRDISYTATRVPLGFGMMWIAGLLSGLLGIGSGTFKVLALDVAMRLPMKVSTTTSNFMIGVTAAASTGIYFARGDIQPLVAAPVALGVLTGATVGARLLAHLSNTTIRKIFVPVLVLIAAEMLIRGGVLLLGTPH